MAPEHRTDPPEDLLAEILDVLGELENTCDQDPDDLAGNLMQIQGMIQSMDRPAKDLQKEKPEHQAAIKSVMQKLNATVNGYIKFEKTEIESGRNDPDFYMIKRPRAAEILQLSVAEAVTYFKSVTS